MSNVNDYPRVKPSSLPYSFRHPFEDSAINDGRNLAHLLDAWLYIKAQAKDTNLSEEANEGLRLVVSLLIDKLDIASGAYRFPMSKFGVDEILAERVDI